MKEPLRCIIIDDEEGAHVVIEHYIKRITTVTLCGNFYNAIEAMDFIYKNQVDLLFLDINMPGLSGLSMLDVMSKRPLVVLTTAHKEYALDGYKYQVVDYLVKPIEFHHFLAAVDKVISRARLSSVNQTAEASRPPLPHHIMLRIEGNLHKISTEDIRYIQSRGNYIKVYTMAASLISPVTTSEIEQKLDKQQFRRIHKSYIIALNQVEKIVGAQVYLKGDVVLPIGNTFRRELLECFQ